MIKGKILLVEDNKNAIQAVVASLTDDKSLIVAKNLKDAREKLADKSLGIQHLAFKAIGPIPDGVDKADFLANSGTETLEVILFAKKNGISMYIVADKSFGLFLNELALNSDVDITVAKDMTVCLKTDDFKTIVKVEDGENVDPGTITFEAKKLQITAGTLTEVTYWPGIWNKEESSVKTVDKTEVPA